MSPAATVAAVRMQRALERLRELQEQAPEHIPPDPYLTPQQRRMCVRQIGVLDVVLRQYGSQADSEEGEG